MTGECAGYAELHAVSAFSFQRGASMPQELVETASALGYRALALTDECSMAGAVRAYEQAERHRQAQRHVVDVLVGSELNFADGLRCVALAETRSGYTQLCRAITRARRASDKGGYRLLRGDVDASPGDFHLLWTTPGSEDLAGLGG